MTRLFVSTAAAALLAAASAHAQDPHAQHQAPPPADPHAGHVMPPAPATPAAPAAPADAHAGHDMADMPGMDMGGHAMPAALGPYPMTREASGTAWQPDVSAHEGIHSQIGCAYLRDP